MQDTLLREFGSNPIPFLGILFVGKIRDSGGGGRITRHWLLGAVIDRKLLEIGQDGERKVGIPGIPADLEGRTGIIFNIHGRFLCFDNEFPGAPDPKSIVNKLGGPPDADWVFVDNFFVLFGIAPGIVDIPTEGLEERINELPPELGFVELSSPVSCLVKFVSLNKFEDCLRDLLSMPPCACLGM